MCRCCCGRRSFGKDYNKKCILHTVQVQARKNEMFIVQAFVCLFENAHTKQKIRAIKISTLSV
jgi:hypothetical protein